MQKYRIILPVVAIVLLVAWYAFRPERLFVNQRVHEELPTAQAANSPASTAPARHWAARSRNFASSMKERSDGPAAASDAADVISRVGSPMSRAERTSAMS